MKWFTSDLHINHQAILTIGKGRPFNTLDEMSDVIVSKWNNKVCPKDDVYVLGDVFWNMNEYQIQQFMDRLNGHKHLILGNHDRINPNAKSNRWVEIVETKTIGMDDTEIILSHFPIFEWQHFYHNTYHLYGHTHATLNLAQYTLQRQRPNGNCWDVGVDNNNFEPVSFAEIKEKIKNNIEELTKK